MYVIDAFVKHIVWTSGFPYWGGGGGGRGRNNKKNNKKGTENKEQRQQKLYGSSIFLQNNP